MHNSRNISSSNKRYGLTLSAAALTLAISMPAVAQEVASQEEVLNDQRSVAQEDSENVLGEVIVTARRKEESLQDVPISVVALSGDFIAERNVVSLEDLSVYTPNFRQNNGIISGYRLMRGVSSGSNFSFDQAVGGFSDGLYIGRAQLARMPFFDVERVEVLRGPQVILFGNSTTAGAISSVTRKPGGEFSANLRGSYEFNNEETVLEGGVTVPLGDKFSVRLAGFSQNLDKGWIKSDFDGVRTEDPRLDTLAFRVTASYSPSSDLTATLRYENAEINVDGGTQQAVLNRLGVPLVGEVSFDDHRTVGSGSPFGINDQSGVPNDYVRLDPELWLGTIEYQAGDVTITSQTGYITFGYQQGVESDWIAAPVAQIIQSEGYEQFSQEIRLAGVVGGFVDYQAGVYYQDDTRSGDLRFDFNFPALGSPLPPFGLHSGAETESTSWSVFTDLTFNLSDRLRLGLGARYTESDRTTDQFNHASVVGTGAYFPLIESAEIAPGVTIFNAVGNAPHDYYNVSDSESKFQPQVLLQYDITPDVMGYLKYVKGSKAGGYDWLYRGPDPRGGLFQPETATSYEVGVKGIFFDRTLSVELQGYRTEFKDLQVSAFDGVASLVVKNAAEQTSQGVELESVWRPFPELTFNLSGAYLDAVYDDFPEGACNTVSKLATPAGVTCTQNYSGTEPAFQSKWSGNLGAQYDVAVGDYSFTPRLDLTYRSSYNASTNNDPEGVQDGYVLVDGRIELTRDGAPWSVSLFGKNLTDERYMEFFLDAPLITGLSSASSNRGRQVGVQLSTQF
ncbi:MAG: TonB-dependent receptor [Hyphomonas sp.]|nr:TonB-dependent receptor [Hyphomonas sp.]MCC0017591.1 TonB-dependent receptor [Rhodobiaceae bacterium]